MTTKILIPRPEIIDTVPAEAFAQLGAHLHAVGAKGMAIQFIGAEADPKVEVKTDVVPLLAPFVGPVALREAQHYGKQMFT